MTSMQDSQAAIQVCAPSVLGTGRAQNDFLQANASGSNIRAEINLMPPHTSTLSVTVQAGADRGTVTKQTSANWSKCCD